MITAAIMSLILDYCGSSAYKFENRFFARQCVLELVDCTREGIPELSVTECIIKDINQDLNTKKGGK